MDEPTQHHPTPQPPRRRRPTLVLSAVFGALLLAGVLVAAVLAGPVSAGRAPASSADSGSLDTLFEPAADPLADPLAAAPQDRPGRHWRGHRGPLRLGDGEKVLAGAVSSVVDGKLVVTKDSGGEITVPTDGDTRVRGASNKSLVDLQAGERVIVKAGSDGIADRVLVVRAHATGTVIELDGDRATVRSPGGLTHQLDLSGVAQRPAVGTVVVAVGAATEDGATLKVEELRELPTLG